MKPNRRRPRSGWVSFGDGFGYDCGGHSGEDSGCTFDTRADGGGHPCLWFSQGCLIVCDNVTQHAMG